MGDEMTTASNTPYQNPAWGRSGGGYGWSAPPYWAPFWHPDGISRPLGFAAMILGFIFWWPVGLALLFFMIFSGRIGCRHRRWAAMNQDQNQGGDNGWQPMAPPWAKWCGGDRAAPPPRSSGNHAFDEYRAETLRRLEDEQKDFSSFLERLRFAKDKAEFDQFMADRRHTPTPPAATDEPSHG
jgi:hypothetical protein